MSKKNKNDRDQNWRIELGLEEGPQKKSKLIKCKSCKKRISVLAETCPGCGAPNESKEISEKKSMAGVYIFLLICFILILIFYTYHGRLYSCKLIYFFFSEVIDGDFYNNNCFYKLLEMKSG